MSVPKPKPPVRKVKNSKKTKEPKKKMMVYICTMPNGKKLEVRAPELLAVGDICKKRFKEFPVDVKLKPFERKEHLSSRPLMNHEGLATLKNQLTQKGVA